jgi:hypothetical protein
MGLQSRGQSKHHRNWINVDSIVEINPLKEKSNSVQEEVGNIASKMKTSLKFILFSLYS